MLVWLTFLQLKPDQARWLGHLSGFSINWPTEINGFDLDLFESMRSTPMNLSIKQAESIRQPIAIHQSLNLFIGDSGLSCLWVFFFDQPQSPRWHCGTIRHMIQLDALVYAFRRFIFPVSSLYNSFNMQHLGLEVSSSHLPLIIFFCCCSHS